MPKILFISNTANFQKFNLPFMRMLRDKGWKVDYASPADEPVTECDNFFEVNMPRSPLHFIKIIRAISLLRRIFAEYHYDVIHCHTPVGSVVTRIAAKKLWKQHKIKVIYTAHGFHFFKGAPFINWLIFYPIEKYLSHFTDILILINQEDYELAIRKNFRAGEIIKMDGVGVDLKKFTPFENPDEEKYKTNLREQYGCTKNDFILLYIAEFIPRKNHELLLRSIPYLRKQIPELKVILPGKGILLEQMKNLAVNLRIDNIVKFLGYRKNIENLCHVADLYVATSTQEGLPVSVIEAMASGLPLIVSNIRGHRDVCVDGRNGFLFDLKNEAYMNEKIIQLYQNQELREQIIANAIFDSKKFSLNNAIAKMEKIYTAVVSNTLLEK